MPRMLVLFDIDDTLIDHSAAVRDGVTALHEHVRPAEEASAFHASWVVAMKTYFPRFLSRELSYQDQRRARMRHTVGAQLSDAQADELFDVYFRVYESRWSLYPDVLPSLAELSGHRLGIISNGNGVEQRSKLARTGIADRFEFVHISDECSHAKPAAEIFLRACTMAGVAPRDAIYVGDLYEIDAIGSRAAGLHGVWLNRDTTHDRDYAPPMIRGLDELPSVVRGLGQTRHSSTDVISPSRGES
jgi:putative hydrolase of the HAD superfamily